jgi:hypothetical protein
MSVHKTRLRTIQALLAGSAVGTHTDYPTITGELQQVLEVRRIPALPRRRLLQILHSTRALDSSLRTFTTIHGCCPVSGQSLKVYLDALTKHTQPSLGRLTPDEVKHFQRTIINIRNKYMHAAGSFPAGDAEIATLLSEMQLCLARVLAL